MRTRRSFKLRLTPLHRQSQFPAALRILIKLRNLGHETVFAGGCVRDGLLGVMPKDLDLATAASPDLVEEAFSRTLAVGKAFGTIVVVEDGHNFEVTTFRREGGYADGRHPDRVEFTDLAEDASRRDFTVNALFYDPKNEEVIDCVEGLEDLKKRRLRTVGRAEERFQEDRLRMLRAARFVAQLGFSLDSQALAAIQSQHAAISQVSAERVFAEMRRLLSSLNTVDGMEVLRASRLDKELWPESLRADFVQLRRFTPFLNWEHAFAAVTLLAGEVSGETRLRAWKAPRESQRRIQLQIDGCRLMLAAKTSRAARARVLGGEVFAEVLQLARGLNGDDTKLKLWISEFLKVADQQGSLPKPFLTGQDLLALGISAGEKMGFLLKTLYDDQLEGKLRSKAEALERLKQL